MVFRCLFELVQVGPDLEHIGLNVPAQALLMEGGGGVVHGEIDDAVLLLGRAVYLADALPREEHLHGMAPQRDHDPGLYDAKLLLEPRPTSGHLARERVSIVRGTVFDDVGDVNLIALQANRGEEAFKELASSTNKGSPLLIFVIARPLADEHQFGVVRAFTGNSPCRRFVQAAPLASCNLAVQVD
jgi:hypothetical protein